MTINVVAASIAAAVAYAAAASGHHLSASAFVGVCVLNMLFVAQEMAERGADGKRR